MKQTVKWLIRVVTILVLWLLGDVPTLVTGATLSGKVTDAINGAPIAGAIVWLEATSYSDTTDSAGDYFIAGVPAGIYTVVIEALNYRQKVITGFQVNEVVPVELVSFTAHLEEDGVVLQWRTDSEGNSLGFEVYRKAFGESEFEKIGWVPTAGSTSTLRTYYFVDSLPNVDRTYFYKLKQLNADGSFTWTDEVEIYVPKPTVFLLDQNYPNPFNPSTRIRYQLAQNVRVTLKVFNLLGKEVDTLIHKWQPAGRYSVTWHGRDRLGSRLPSGVYLYQLKAGSFKQTRRMILLE